MKYRTSLVSLVTFSLVLMSFPLGVAYATPSLHVTSPNGAECFVPGYTIPIQWSKTEIAHVAIAYRLEGESAPPVYSSDPTAWNIIHDPNLTGTSYNWVPPTTLNVGVYYKIWIEGHDTVHSRLVLDSSDAGFRLSSSCGTGSGDTTPPLISGVSQSNLTSSSVTISWTTNEPAYSKVEYGTTTAYGNSSAFTTATSTTHSITLTGLSPNTTYYYKAVSNDVAGNSGNVPSTFVTLSSGSVATSTPETPPMPATSTIPITSTKTLSGRVAASDGTSISDANVWAHNSVKSTGNSATTDASGNYTMMVSGGSWEVGVNPLNFNTANWTYTAPPFIVTFIDDAIAESKIQNFTVTSLAGTATLKGVVRKPDGTPIQDAYVQVHDANWVMNYGGPSGSDGSYTVRGIPAGTYQVDVYPPGNTTGLMSPPRTTLTFAASETKTLDLQFIRPSKTISGRVTDSAGGIVTDAGVWANNQANGLNVSSETNSAGSYTLGLIGGTWEVGIYAKNYATATWTYNQPPVLVSFANDITQETKTQNFVVTSLAGTATLTGKVTDPAGVVVLGAYVQVHTKDWSMNFGSPVEKDGSYTVRGITPGTYLVEVYPPPERSDLTSPSPLTLTFSTSQTITQNFQLKRGTKTLLGKVTASDGTVITDAMVWAYNETTSSGKQAETDALGNYTMTLSGGTWNVGINPKDYAKATWSYGGEPVRITFADNETLETLTQNFTVLKADAAVRGKVLLPGGAAPDSRTTSVNLWSSLSRNGAYVPLSSDGSFNAPVPAGTYEIHVWSEDSSLRAPELPSFSVKSGTTYDLGTITLVRASDHIKGKVTDSQGNPITKMRIHGWVPEGKGWAEAETDSTGSYDLLVTPGIWEVMVGLDPSLPYSYNQPPQKVTVVSGVPTTGVNFVLSLADATISGKVVDPSGTVVTDFYGFAYAYSPTSGPGGGFGAGGPVDRGQFSFRVPAGTYNVGVDVPSGSLYGPGAPQTVTVASGGTATVTLTLKKNDAKIVGTLRDASGNPVTGVMAEVFAGNPSGIWQRGVINLTTGTFTIEVAAGTWHVGVHVDSASGYISREGGLPVTITSGQTVTHDLVLQKAASTLEILVKDPSGLSLSGAWVSVDRVSFSSAESVSQDPELYKDIFVAGGQSDSNGKLLLKVPAGTFYVHVFLPPDRGFVNPKEQRVTVAEGQTAPVTLMFRRADLTISGRVLLNGVGTEAFVWGWSEGGGYTEVPSGPDGTYTLRVTGQDTWHIGANKDIVSGEFYYSSELVVKMSDAAVSGQDITLIKSSLRLPDSSTRTYDATNFQSMSLEDGTKVVIPANSLSTTGNVTFTISPSAEVSALGNARVVGVGYDIDARDATGQVVTELNSEITITLPYSDAALKEGGVSSADLLSPSFWDESISAWRPLETFVHDPTSKTFTCTVDHLTRFALVTPAAAAEVPAAPTGEPQPPVQITPATGLEEGDLVRGPDGIKVYIINATGYKRHIFNPAVFGMYGHLSWGNIKAVSQTTLDLYVTSDLYRELTDPKVYSLEEVNEAQGIAAKHWIDMTPAQYLARGYVWGQVFVVNETERDYYQTGTPITN